ncbi:urease, beta subunit [Dactylococcopsis salina PCC 8305]|uniref:Urease subunit beta n=1 Tax=Dactylococcopsis salina (strain PCC 8305) TaxID=13035 RepID=K9YVC9_DACS8|nr:urease subunit beta [Dactylococcopsis salina]AFZ50285.1 urease, beta subunit [Dactylococcopsis salina PCC 8305]
MTESSFPFEFPGQIDCVEGEIELNKNRESCQIRVANEGDRPIQVGSHYHFFEVNRALKFDRKKALGFRLDIPAGTAVRFEPGDTKEVTLVALGGDKTVIGLNNLVNGNCQEEMARKQALKKAEENGFN